eukprot:TRINITY_DN38979_c0_g1_i1.p1 TRINITY_DN38979_c0_g1~~TRINITY_DN38979_c0_g1_i1.p1  ORF type:complete len:339 (-),score=39.27 TRINITY_DN38979_c0_g1_i1:110-1126(-)
MAEDQAADKHPIVQHVFFVRHAESRWNLAQSQNNFYGMFCENDHGITELGKSQAESVRSSLTKLVEASQADPASLSAFRRWDHEYVQKLVKPNIIYSSPFTRAIETALISFQDVLATTGELVIMRNAREQRNSLLSSDAAGVAVGDDISVRAKNELNSVYGDEGVGASLSDGLKINVAGVTDEWWSASADSDADVEARQEEFLDELRSAGPGASIIVVGHSHFFRRFFRRYLTAQAKMSHPDIAGSLQEKVIPPCGVIGMRVEWTGTGEERLTAGGSPAGCILEAVPLLGTNLQPAEMRGMTLLPFPTCSGCAGRARNSCFSGQAIETVNSVNNNPPE